MVRAPATRLYGLLLLACLAFGAGPAAAAGNEVEGRGFGARFPTGFKATTSSDEDDSSVRGFRRRVDGGSLELTFSSFEQNDCAAKLEMELGAALDGLAGKIEFGDGEATTNQVRVTGATDAHEVAVIASSGSQRTLRARLDNLIVVVELTSPASAEAEATEAWNLVLTSLKVEEPSNSTLVVLLGSLGGLLLVGLLLHFGRARKPPQAPESVEVDPLAKYSSEKSASAPVEAYQPTRLPDEVAAIPRTAGAGFSRADDGMPVFTAETKQTGAAELLKLHEVPRRPHATAAPAAPTRAPNLRPPTPAIRV